MIAQTTTPAEIHRSPLVDQNFIDASTRTWAYESGVAARSAGFPGKLFKYRDFKRELSDRHPLINCEAHAMLCGIFTKAAGI